MKQTSERGRPEQAIASMAAAAVALLVLVVPARLLAESGVLETQRLGQIEFMSGGVGEGDLAEMRALAPDYNLKILTATPSGSYVGAADVTIVGADGSRVLSTRTRGPLFYARLPEGRYAITVSDGDDVQQRTVQVGSAPLPEVVITLDAATPVERPAPRTAAKRAPSRSPEAAAARRARVEDRGVSLYDLDPNAAARAKAQVKRYEVYPDGTRRPLDETGGAPSSENAGGPVTIPAAEPVEPGSVDPTR